MSCVVFLDEALWGGDKKREGILKALITEPMLQLEAKFRDPIMVTNRLRIIAASNNDWSVPTGIGDRRWFILNVASTYAGTGHREYWNALYAEIESAGAAAMFYDLLQTDLCGFNVLAMPHTLAKAQQQVQSLTGTEAWLHHILQEGAVGYSSWQQNGLEVATAEAYKDFSEFSREQHEFKPDGKALWSRKIRATLGPCVDDTRLTIGGGRIRSFKFGPLIDCRRRFAKSIGAPELQWGPENDRGMATTDFDPNGTVATSFESLPAEALNQANADLSLVRRET
jgi:hypothetical protein